MGNDTTSIHQCIHKSLQEVEHVPLHRQASHRLCSHVTLLLARADILHFVDDFPIDPFHIPIAKFEIEASDDVPI